MIYSRTAMGENQFQTTSPQCVEIYDDAPLSYMTRRAVDQLTALAASAVVVPTTTRTPEQYNRISLPGGPYRFAVTSNGGAILVNGVRDRLWDSHISEQVATVGTSLADILAALTERVPVAHPVDGWVRKVRVADDLFCYLVVEPSRQPVEFLPAWQELCAASGWSASQQGRKIYTMPLAVTKSAAIGEVRRRLVADGTLSASHTLLAAGDGWLDNDLLLAADAAIRPRHGELESLGWQAANVSVTVGAGALAGEEILSWMHSRTAHILTDRIGTT
ncbi:HAD family hydrolase [Gordonia sp. CPCC 205333]|uniref:HAD family hydrolase n=1 Tax=Gordonia sp. CPCC 205333 TaxID=3140790 RepID=UPI003AF37D62